MFNSGCSAEYTRVRISVMYNRKQTKEKQRIHYIVGYNQICVIILVEDKYWTYDINNDVCVMLQCET